MTNKVQLEVEQDNQDYICLTDMFRDEEGQPYSQLDEKSQYCGLYWIMGDV